MNFKTKVNKIFLFIMPTYATPESHTNCNILSYFVYVISCICILTIQMFYVYNSLCVINDDKHFDFIRYQ